MINTEKSPQDSRSHTNPRVAIAHSWKNLKQGCAEDVIVTPKVKAAQLLTRQIQSPTVRV